MKTIVDRNDTKVILDQMIETVASLHAISWANLRSLQDMVRTFFPLSIVASVVTVMADAGNIRRARC